MNRNDSRQSGPYFLKAHAGRPWRWRLAGVCLIAASLCWASWFTQEPYHYQHLVVHLIFPVMLYFGVLALFNRYGALAVTVALINCLHVINQRKLQATAEPILAIDLIQFGQAVALTSYVDIQLILAALLLLLAFLWASVFQRSGTRAWLRPLFALPLVLAFVIQLGTIPSLGGPLRIFMRDTLRLNYSSWDMPRNLRRNGLLGHLWLTSEVSPLPRRTHGEIQFYQLGHGRKHVAQTFSRPLDLYLILCEGCWGEEGKLRNTPLNQLLRKGFLPATVYSPEFGGGTANAEFEMLTGLPARGLRGVVYMHYGEAMRPRSDSLPGELRAEGFKTHAIHNYTRTFWKRNMIYPKFGFDQLTFIEDMPWNGKGWPDDQLLFDAALTQVREKVSGNRFFFMITVHTHGLFAENDNRGYGDYERRLTQTMGQLSDFIDKVYAHNRSDNRQAMFLVFGDHKPALLKWFYDEGVLDRALFRRVGATTADFRIASDLTPAQRRSLNSVPLLVGSDNPALDMAQLITQLQNKPFYCVSATVASKVLQEPSVFFRSAYEFCQSDSLDTMLFTSKLFGARYFTPAVYADRLFQ